MTDTADTVYKRFKAIGKAMGNIYLPPRDFYLVAIDPGVLTGIVWATFENGKMYSMCHGVTLRVDPDFKKVEKSLRYAYWLTSKLSVNNSLTIIETFTARKKLYHTHIKAARIFGFLAGIFSTKSEVKYFYPTVWKPLWDDYLELVNSDTKTLAREALGKRTSVHLRDAFSMFTLVAAYLMSKRAFYEKR